MPSFTLGKNTNNCIVHGEIISLEHLTAINVTYRVNSPGDVPHYNLSDSEAPDHSWKSTEQVIDQRLESSNLEIVLLQELVVFLVGKVFNVLLVNQNYVGP